MTNEAKTKVIARWADEADAQARAADAAGRPHMARRWRVELAVYNEELQALDHAAGALD